MRVINNKFYFKPVILGIDGNSPDQISEQIRDHMSKHYYKYKCKLYYVWSYFDQENFKIFR